MTPRLIGLGLALAGLVLAAWRIDAAAYGRGYKTRVAEEAALSQEKIHDANRADDGARRCALDPACRLRNDGWRRD